MRSQRLWYPRETATLIKMWQAGKTYREIAEALTCTPDRVRSKVVRLRAQGIELRGYKKARPQPAVKKVAPPPIEPRRCLQCRESFRPPHKGIFRCPDCHRLGEGAGLPERFIMAL